MRFRREAGLWSAVVIGLISGTGIIYATTRVERVYTEFDQRMTLQTGMQHWTEKAPAKAIGLTMGVPLIAVSLVGGGVLLWGNPKVNQPLPMPLINQAALPEVELEPSRIQAIELHSPQPTSHTPTTASPSAKKQQLWQLIISDEYRWVAQLLEATPLLIWGQQRSGKSEFAHFLILLRRLFFNHQIEIIDPHAHLNNWAASIPVYGREFDYAAINRRIQSYRERLKIKGQKFPYTTLWDEFSDLKGKCDCEALVKSFSQESQKCEEYPIIVAHGRTAEYLGGTKGTYETIQEGFIQLHFFGERGQTGRIQAAGRGLLTGLTKDLKGNPEEIEVAIPEWMQGSYLLQMFPSLNIPLRSIDAIAPDFPMPPTPSQDFPPPSRNPHPELEFVYWLDAVEPKHEEALPEALQAIWQWGKALGEPFTARIIQQATLSTLKGMSADDIRAAFKELEALGKGKTEGEGSRMTFCSL